MNNNQAFALVVGLLVFFGVIMPGITRYLIIGGLILIAADVTVARLTGVDLIPFFTL